MINIISPRDHGLNIFIRCLLLGLAFCIPIQTLLPIKTFRPVELLIFLAVVYAIWDRREFALPLPLLISFAVGLLSLVISTAFSLDPRLSLDTGLLEFIVPFALLYLFVAYGDSAFSQHAAILFVAGVAILSTAQIISIAPGFPNGTPPFTGPDFLRVKMDVDLMRRSLTIGNSDNYASLWVLVLPTAVGLLSVAKSRWPLVLATTVIGYAGFLVYSRSALLLAMLAVMAIGIAAAFRGQRREILISALVAILILSMLINPKSIEYFSSGTSDFLTAVNETTISISSPEEPQAAAPSSSDLSGTDRAEALDVGISIAMNSPLIGIGFGMYPVVEPIFTAPHSQVILRFAEGGILGLLSFLILFFYSLVECFKSVFSRRASWFKVICLTALSAFMLKSSFFGAAMAVSSNIVWGCGVALLLSGSIRDD